MSAIRNVGELASPYFLVEVWSRRDEIDIDPETFATLKVKCRRLVRDFRAFDLRNEEPDEEWRAQRRDVLGLEPIVPLRIDLNGSETTLSVFRNEEALDTVLLGDLPGAPDPDCRLEGAEDPPATAFELALDRYEGEADWGLLLAGVELRLYRRSSGISQQYLAVDLSDLVELDDHDHWRAFAGIFRANSFEPDADGVPLVRRVVDESRRHATRLAEDMRDDVVEAAESVIQAVLDDAANRELVGQPSRALLQVLFEQTLYYLYRVLFILYAEAHDVLPLSGGGAYATTYSVDHLAERARVEPPGADGSYYRDALSRLFAILWEGPAGLAGALGIEPVGGELFDPARTELLDRCRIGDAAWRRAIIALVLGGEGSPRRALGRRSSFAEIGVDRLGSIYEGLLTLEPYYAPGPRVLVFVGGERRVYEPHLTGDLKAVRELPEGAFVLESASGRRKGSGSFYTPAEITEYLAHAALDPIVASVLEKANEDSSSAAAGILALRVCDPAMGSGAFLVQSARVLGLAVARARAAGRDGRVTPELIRQAKRDVVRRCLYGVDLNPLAVVLAKVSLWLETLERGKPLSFLDAHLRRGDALLGVDFESESGALTADDLCSWPKEAAKGLETYLKKEGGERGQPALAALRKRKTPRTSRQASLPGIGPAALEQTLAEIAATREALSGEGEESLQLELEHARAFAELEAKSDSLRNRLRAAADFWCAQWFSEGEDAAAQQAPASVPCGVGEFEEILALLLVGGQAPQRLAYQVAAAREAAHAREFFHWALEFPEVMVERGGFDAVIGNPPWNTLSPDVKEFFSTYDPVTFRKGVPKGTQTARKEELRQDLEIDGAWRRQARFLHELSNYAKPASNRFTWFAEDGQLRKGDANVFRLFVERAYRLLRPGGRLAQVLPESVYMSSPATGVRQRLLTEGLLERCFAFENRRAIFPIHRSVKVVLLTAQHSGGPTRSFKAAFLVGKDAAGRDRSVSVEELPATLANLEERAPELAVADIRALAPETWAFPELQTALDAQIAAQLAAAHPPLNLDDRGWNLRFCRELDADKDAWRFKDASYLEQRGAIRDGLRWRDPEGFEWWPLVEGALFYHLEFPAGGKEPSKWVNGREAAAIEARQNDDGRSVMRYYRVAWRDVASSTNERSAIACVLPPRTVAKDTTLTVWGGWLPLDRVLVLAGVLASLVFDYLVRAFGKTHLKYAAIGSVPVPPFGHLSSTLVAVLDLVSASSDFDELREELCPDGAERKVVDPWATGVRRAALDATIARVYGLTLEQYAAMLSTFPLLDRIQPMLPGEPKSFVTRDLTLLAYCELCGKERVNIVEVLEAAGVVLPKPHSEFRSLDCRVQRYQELGAVAYSPTPRGGRPPTDPELIDSVRAVLSGDPQSAVEIGELLEEDEKTVSKVLQQFLRDAEVFAQGRGASRRYYVIEGDE